MYRVSAINAGGAVTMGGIASQGLDGVWLAIIAGAVLGAALIVLAVARRTAQRR
ncbi:hypothetical protein SAMN04489867_3047 [Pedococcus dokdonensis]|uniref:Uncharacterized protein n=1 Tax=Pedococcus dokdonensis TaxID=443156 RepID=A0A1H0U056_9MICO|nr:hypothetical protein [Pedococcus dokdonensis]SDP59196.1 hypothetical protein SAMN04489867_3047 [Pedococcus dokdonensis]